MRQHRVRPPEEKTSFRPTRTSLSLESSLVSVFTQPSWASGILSTRMSAAVWRGGARPVDAASTVIGISARTDLRAFAEQRAMPEFFCRLARPSTGPERSRSCCPWRAAATGGEFDAGEQGLPTGSGRQPRRHRSRCRRRSPARPRPRQRICTVSASGAVPASTRHEAAGLDERGPVRSGRRSGRATTG